VQPGSHPKGVSKSHQGFVDFLVAGLSWPALDHSGDGLCLRTAPEENAAAPFDMRRNGRRIGNRDLDDATLFLSRYWCSISFAGPRLAPSLAVAPGSPSAGKSSG